MAPLGAPGGGATGLGWPSRGHGRARLGETSTMEASPSRNVDGKEKLDGGGADFERRRRLGFGENGGDAS